MTEASYTAWDDNLYEWPPPDGWYQADDGKWWPQGFGPHGAQSADGGGERNGAGPGLGPADRSVEVDDPGFDDGLRVVDSPAAEQAPAGHVDDERVDQPEAESVERGPAGEPVSDLDADGLALDPDGDGAPEPDDAPGLDDSRSGEGSASAPDQVEAAGPSQGLLRAVTETATFPAGDPITGPGSAAPTDEGPPDRDPSAGRADAGSAVPDAASAADAPTAPGPADADDVIRAASETASFPAGELPGAGAAPSAGWSTEGGPTGDGPPDGSTADGADRPVFEDLPNIDDVFGDGGGADPAPTTDDEPTSAGVRGVSEEDLDADRLLEELLGGDATGADAPPGATSPETESGPSGPSVDADAHPEADTGHGGAETPPPPAGGSETGDGPATVTAVSGFHLGELPDGGGDRPPTPDDPAASPPGSHAPTAGREATDAAAPTIEGNGPPSVDRIEVDARVPPVSTVGSAAEPPPIRADDVPAHLAGPVPSVTGGQAGSPDGRQAPPIDPRPEPAAIDRPATGPRPPAAVPPPVRADDAPRARRWPLVAVLIGLLLIGAGTLVFLVAADDGEEPLDLEAALNQTGRGSFNEPYTFGLGVVVYYHDDDLDEERRWVVQVTDPIVVESSADDDQASGSDDAMVVAVARVRIMYESGPVPGQPSDLRLSAIASEPALLEPDECPAIADQLDTTIELAPTDTIEGDLCWAVPAADVEDLTLAVEAAPVQGVVFLSLS